MIISLNSFSRFSSTSSDLAPLHLIYSPYYIIHKSSLYMPKHYVSLVSTIFSTICTTPTMYLMSSFLILFCLVLPHIQHNILISTMLNLFSCWFFTVQHCPVQHRRSYSFSIRFSLKFERYFRFRVGSLSSNIVQYNIASLTVFR